MPINSKETSVADDLNNCRAEDRSRISIHKEHEFPYRTKALGVSKDREARLQELASKLLFTLRKEGSRFGLYRDADVSEPVRREGLTIDEVQATLNTWKLRGG
jgi:hypothetical protein